VPGSRQGPLTSPGVLRYHRLVTPNAVKRGRKSLGLSQSEFAALLGVHVVTVKKWETGKLGMRQSTERLIRLVVNTKRRASLTSRTKKRRRR
jgi:DNA-binding transcriptional regulator YiaG